ncbi:MAG: hypothetical protein J6C31_00555 [Prevotella sp.]|nr:hypothetical protein [Prevotella sp.]
MNFLKKYWWRFIIAVIVIPVITNFILLIPTFTPIVGDNTSWLSFFGSFIGAIASFVMIFFTTKTLEQNEKQLNELRRQWNETNRPRLYGRISCYQHAFYLEIYNAGSQDANCVEVKINADFYNNIQAEFKYIYDSMVEAPFYVKAGHSVNFFIGVCREINDLWKNLSFNIEITGTYNNQFPLNISLPIKHFINKNYMVVRTPMEKALEDISEGLVRPHLVSKPKAIQIYIRSIAESLEKITQYIASKNGTEQDK